MLDRIIRLPELCRLVGVKRSTVYDWVNPRSKRHDPSFPRPIPLTDHLVGFSFTEVQDWIAKRKNARGAERS